MPHDLPQRGLLGRHSESTTLDRLLDVVRAGESRALVIRGDPGMGKTALLEYVVERASGGGRGRGKGGAAWGGGGGGGGVSGGSSYGRPSRDGARVRGAASALRADARS